MAMKAGLAVGMDSVLVSGPGGAPIQVRLSFGAQRGDLFKVAELGTRAGDRINPDGSAVAMYVNAGGHNDVMIGGMANDFRVDNLGDDTLRGGKGPTR